MRVRTVLLNRADELGTTARKVVAMKVDLTVAAIPGFVAAMAAEYWWQRRHPESLTEVPVSDADTGAAGVFRPGEYEWRDTLASLAMGLGSLIAPAIASRVLTPVTPGQGRFAKAMIGAGLAAAAVVTLGDVRRNRHLAAGETQSPSGAPPSAQAPLADGAAVIAVTSAALAVSTTWGVVSSGRRLYQLGGRDLGTGPAALAIAVLGWDLIYYFNHRLSHECRWLWAVHVVHHSSERYNLSTALRQPVAEGVSWTMPYGLLAYAGVRPELIEQARALNLLYQFFIHTEVVGSLGPLERVLNTPSHHRVHHGVNRRYLDRNHGSILIIWDRLFGTFEPETERVVYGLTRNIDTFNPLRIATHEWIDIGRDIACSRSWGERWSFLLRGPGWAGRRRAHLQASR